MNRLPLNVYGKNMALAVINNTKVSKIVSHTSVEEMWIAGCLDVTNCLSWMRWHQI